jgi:CHASE1-domain containing sensor protein
MIVVAPDQDLAAPKGLTSEKDSTAAPGLEMVDIESQQHLPKDGHQTIVNGKHQDYTNSKDGATPGLDNADAKSSLRESCAAKQKPSVAHIDERKAPASSETVAEKEHEEKHEVNSVSHESVVTVSSGVAFPIWITITLIVFLGAATCAGFLAIGITAANRDQSDQFNRLAQDLTNQIQQAWEDYVVAASWIHGQCRGRNFTRADFRQTYEYLRGSGLDFQAAQFDPNITREEREEVEAEARAFYALHYPHIEYKGIIGFETANSTTLEPRSEQDFYVPIHVSVDTRLDGEPRRHRKLNFVLNFWIQYSSSQYSQYMEPVIGNEAAIDLDYHASGSRKRTVLYCMNEGKPALTDRLRLVQEKTESAFGVVLMHPGFNITEKVAELRAAEAQKGNVAVGMDLEDLDLAAYTPKWPRDLASIVIRIPDLLLRAGKNRGDPSIVYVYDNSDSGGSPLFLGAAEIVPQSENQSIMEFLPEKTIEEVHSQVEMEKSLLREQTIQVANKIWTVSVHSVEGTYQPVVIFVILGGVIIFAASIALAIWMYTNQRRITAYNKERMDAEAERAALVLDNAKQATKAERELNDFIAQYV